MAFKPHSKTPLSPKSRPRYPRKPHSLAHLAPSALSIGQLNFYVNSVPPMANGFEAEYPRLKHYLSNTCSYSLSTLHIASWDM